MPCTVPVISNDCGIPIASAPHEGTGRNTTAHRAHTVLYQTETGHGGKVVQIMCLPPRGRKEEVRF
jgi:hypothetical protein